jgi:hypothetical protein
LEADAHDVLGKRIFLCDARIAHDTGDRLILGHPLGLDQQFKRAEPATARGNLELAGLLAIIAHHGPDVETLEQSPTIDVVG